MKIWVNARRWFQRGPGNTYHTVSVTIRDDDGITTHVGISDMTYGYGEHYLHTAGTLLAESGIEEFADMDPYEMHDWRTLEERGIVIFSSVTDGLKRDLHRKA